ncbi:urokinase plasminogen activator surface receptor-like [Carassius auratus]|uniref:Urokinase plasminogen activator surface receptor-like n=1 Tax=Carassius auratus TaxID=7957 RepID=A0A6P6LZI5_CARAU|nr:urokinase plasminogen activator surface receptor-like [Carassius auratus]XP_052392979.1 urokinase plasminogen activator surface receptor-like [Carassius gibelio]
MDLHVSVFLLFILFTAGHSLNCNQCPGVSNPCEKIPCPDGLSNCFAATAYASALGVSSSLVTVKSCAPAGCPSGSINLGIIKLSSYCCGTDFCNAQDSPDPSTNAPNGKTCYSCNGTSCSNLMICSGSEDRCFEATTTFGGQSVGVKGCVSKAICDATSLIPNVQGISCCSGNLCNGAQSVTQSFLFLCCSLLSFILLH